MKKILSQLPEKLLQARPVQRRDRLEEARFLQYTAILILGELVFCFFGLYNFLVGRFDIALLLTCVGLSLVAGWILLFRGGWQRGVYRINCLLLLWGSRFIDIST